MNEQLQCNIDMKFDNILNIDYNYINDLNKSLNNLNNNTNLELVSIDEFSIITNRGPTHGWSLKGHEVIIKIPFTKPNKRYSLLMATTKEKIIKYILIEGSIKNDDFITFISDLEKLNKNYSYLIDNASIHCSKKSKNFYKKNNVHIIYNAPYQSKFNPIEMVFSLLRKQINKKIVKTNDEIIKEIDFFILNIKKETLKNIFIHSTKLLKSYLDINKT